MLLRSNALIDHLDDANALEDIIDHLFVVFWSHIDLPLVDLISHRLNLIENESSLVSVPSGLLGFRF